MSGINIAYLCSGSQFAKNSTSPSTSSSSSSSFDKEVALYSQKDKRPLSSNQRLSSFYSKTLEVHEPATNKKFNVSTTPTNKDQHDAQAAVIVGINVDALRSGRQFVSPAESQFVFAKKRMGTNTRLAMFHDKTIRAYQNSTQHNKQEGINLDFLRSGRQFVTPPENNYTFPKELRSLHSRRAEFYQRTINAHNQSKSHMDTQQESKSEQEPEQEQFSINLDFIRSGLEFGNATAASPEAKRWDRFKTTSRHARLEKFHTNSLKAFSKHVGYNKKLFRGINLDFIRSGQEFKGSTAASPEARRWDRFQTNSTSKQSRLEKFHTKTLSAYANSIRSM